MHDEPVTFLSWAGGAMRHGSRSNAPSAGSATLNSAIMCRGTDAQNSQPTAPLSRSRSMLGVMSPSKLHANLSMVAGD